MKIAVYPGSFDPITLGHINVIERASAMVDQLIVGVLNNQAKSPLFNAEERVEMIREATAHLTNVVAVPFDGLTIDFARRSGAQWIIRGLRAVTDFEYELQMAQTNRVLAPEIDTIFFTTELKYAYLSSSTVKEVARFGGDIDSFLTPVVKERTLAKLKERQK
ncbi:MAG: pantetheine-phosphate adenylyltransferase [Lachnospiraceae bacterium]|nr:pantetheine-phosphate adenylyltransferase [Lachnospiraceae bacterium]MBR6527664.1 pantetheine-phosphate adenylyltransferase [Lachnospiraceae bacterium]